MSFLHSRTRSARQGFGKPLPRKEGARLVAGGGRYSDDFNLPSQAQAQFVRSPHAHARIGRIDVAEALAVPGVIAVLTGKDAAADGLAPIPHRPVPTNPNEFPLGGRDGSNIFIAPHPPLAADSARFVGEAVAMVIAETAAAQPRAAQRDAVHESLRDRLRQRCIRGGAGPRRGTQRLGRVRGAPPRGRAAGTLPRHRDRNYIEIATGAPRERALITVRPEGVIDVVIGTLSAGQGHETSFA